MNGTPQQVLTPAERRRRIKKIKRKRRIRLTIVIVAFILLLCAVAAPITAFVVFRVDNYKIDGATRYTCEEIIAASGVANGSSLLFLDAQSVKNSIESSLPYIDSAKVEKLLPGTLVITLTASEKVYAFENEGGYLLTSASLKVLEKVAEPPQGATRVKCKAYVKANNGETIAFAKNDEEDKLLGIIKEINSALNEVGLDGITLINLLDEDSIRLVYDNRLLMRLGENTKIESKISLAKKVIDDQNAVNPARYGMINLKVAKKAYFLPCEAADIQADSDSATEIIPTAEKGTEFSDEDLAAPTDENGVEVTTRKGEETTTVKNRETTTSAETTTKSAA